MKAKDTETRQTKTQKDENLVLPKAYVENVDLYKPALNKIMTTREYNFVAPLISVTDKQACKRNYEKLMKGL